MNLGWPPEELVQDLRPGEACYVSLECALSEWGAISQIPMSWLTVATTGASGEVQSGDFTIEFIHVNRSAAEILAGTVQVPGRPLRLARQDTAREDLLRLGRNLSMLTDLED